MCLAAHSVKEITYGWKSWETWHLAWKRWEWCAGLSPIEGPLKGAGFPSTYFRDYNYKQVIPNLIDMKPSQRRMRTSFEVISEVLYLDGLELHYGDLLNPMDLGGRLIDLIALGMIRPVDSQNLAMLSTPIRA